MRRRMIWAGAALLAALALALVLLRAQDRDAGGPSRPEPSAAAAMPADQLAGAIDARRPAREVAPALAGDPEVELAPQPADGVVLRVVRGLGLDPAPGVIVEVGAVTDERDDDSVRGAVSGESEIERVAAWRRYRADAQGIVRVPRRDGHGEVIARCADGDAFGSVAVEDTDETVLRLMPDAALEVRVFDPDGAPAAGAAVGLYWRDLHGDGGRLATRVADAEGRARFAGTSAHLAWHDPREGTLSAGLAGVFAPPVAVDFDPSALPATLELVRPPRTGLDVRLVDEHGRPWTRPAIVEVFLDDGVPRFDQPAAGIAVAEAEGGVAHLEQIGVDLPLVAVAHGPGLGRSAPVAVRGAAEPGARAAARIVVSPALPPTDLRLLLSTADGPLASRRVQTSISEHGWRAETPPRTGPGGELLVRLDNRRSSIVPFQPALVLAAQTGDVPLVGTLDLRAALAAPDRTHEVVLEPRPPRVRGRVVDARGAPIEGATVFASAEDEPWIAWARTDALGRFGLWFFDREDADLEIDARDRFHARTTVRGVRADGEPLLIRMDATGSIAGTALLPAGVSAREVAALARRALDPGSASTDALAPPGVFELDHLPAGSYDVFVGARVDPEAGARIAGVKVEAGATARDPRLLAVDLRGALRRLDLRIVDAAGAPVEAQVALRASGGARWLSLGTPPGGRVREIAGPGRVDVAVLAFGCFYEERLGLAGDERIEVRAGGLSVRVRLAGAQRHPRAGLAIEWERPGAPAFTLPFFRVSSPLEVDGNDWIAPLSLPGAGRYRLRIDGVPLAWFEVADPPDDREIAIEVPPELSR